jgi:hypothetical protein
MNWVGPGYFLTTGIPLIAGREFDDRDGEHAARVAIVNESIVRRYFPGLNPIGRRIGSSRLDTEIVGVARDTPHQTLHDPPVPMVYFPIDQGPRHATHGHQSRCARRGRPAANHCNVRTAIRGAEPALLLIGVG